MSWLTEREAEIKNLKEAHALLLEVAAEELKGIDIMDPNSNTELRLSIRALDEISTVVRTANKLVEDFKNETNT